MRQLDLDVFLERVDEPVGRLSRARDGTTSFRYLTDALPHPVSLPLQAEPFADHTTRSFFSNLLFENAQREHVAERHGLDQDDVVGLLEHLGEDCPGSICCVRVGNGPAKQPGDLAADYDALGVEDLVRIMASLRDHRRLPEGLGDPSPLAGVQGNIALARLPDGRFGLPKAGLNVPTSHILKVPRPGEMSAVEQEHQLMRIMAEVQPHPVAGTRVFGEGDLRGLLIERFDRVVDGTSIRRIHQEDFHQPALTRSRPGPGNPLFASSGAGGGPGGSPGMDYPRITGET